MTMTLYGIKACDTVKKARTWLDAHGVRYAFHDFRVDGLDKATLAYWVEVAGWEKLLNRNSTTFRALADAERSDLSRASATALMLANPTLIKRPVLVRGPDIHVGFKPEAYAATFAKTAG